MIPLEETFKSIFTVLEGDKSLFYCFMAVVQLNVDCVFLTDDQHLNESKCFCLFLHFFLGLFGAYVFLPFPSNYIFKLTILYR